MDFIFATSIFLNNQNPFDFMTLTDLKEEDLRLALQQKIDQKPKPLGSLGRLETIALQVGMIQKTLEPSIINPHIIVFAGDHGIAATGLVNPFPQSVTAQMVLNFVHGGAAINSFCGLHQIRLLVVDAGVNFDFDPSEGSTELIHAKIGYGTKNYLTQAAMTCEQSEKAIQQGRKLVDLVFERNCNCIGLGEMGIGNSSSAALVMSLVMGIPIEACVGRGTGTSEEQLRIKVETLRKVIEFHFPEPFSPRGPKDILKLVGGFEMAMMIGAYLRAAELNMLIVVDGFIATAALLIARGLSIDILQHCIFAHTSGEQGHEKMLSYLNARPLLNLELRLGEGTGSALAIPLIQSAVHFLREMASFESAGVSNKE